MRALVAKVALVCAMCGSAALGVPASAFADSQSGPTTTFNAPNNSAAGWINAESAYISHRHQIRITYKQAVNSAKMSFYFAVNHSHSDAARAGARATLLSAVATADALETSALADLGAGPPVVGPLNLSEYNLERQAINQDYADTVDAQRVTFQAEVAASTNSAEIVTARANLKIAIAQATMQRSAELIALGARPSKRRVPSGGTGSTTSHSRFHLN
ncbi:MAG: hypothetical protein HKL86_05700 [Acidimicrobiaceae bacterium]|nr:hypothetical protein [Acidimicrobiaceae bacterium]